MSAVSTVSLLGGVRVPGVLPQRSSTPSRPNEAQRLTLPAGQYGSSSRQVSSLAFVGAFRHQQADNTPSRVGGSFVRPDCPPSILESIDETAGPPLDLEDVDMAKLDVMKLKGASKAPSRSALEQASLLTNDALYQEQKPSKQGKGRFGMLGL